MNRKDTVLFLGLFAVIALLLLNLLKPSEPHAYDLPQQGSADAMPMAISASGDSAWAIVGGKVYYLSMRNRSDLPSGQRSINVIDSKNLE